MSRSKLATVVFLGLGLVVIALFVRAREGGQSEREAMYYRYLEFASYVKGGSIQPHWLADGSSFWYAEGAPASTGPRSSSEPVPALKHCEGVHACSSGRTT